MSKFPRLGRGKGRQADPMDGAMDLAFLVMFMLLALLARRVESTASAPPVTLKLPTVVAQDTRVPDPKATKGLLQLVLRNPLADSDDPSAPSTIEFRDDGWERFLPDLNLPLSKEAAAQALDDEKLFYLPVRDALAEILTPRRKHGTWGGERLVLVTSFDVPFVFVDQVMQATKEVTVARGIREVKMSYRARRKIRK